MMDRAIGPPLTEAERAAFVTAVRKCIGIKFRHMGRKGCGYGHQTGLDCAGVLLFGMLRVPRPVQDMGKYAPVPGFDRLRQTVRANLGLPVTGELRPGDVPLMRFAKQPQHVAVIGNHPDGGLSLIHTDSTFGKVTEHRLDAYWLGGIVEVYRP